MPFASVTVTLRDIEETSSADRVSASPSLDSDLHSEPALSFSFSQLGEAISSFWTLIVYDQLTSVRSFTSSDYYTLASDSMGLWSTLSSQTPYLNSSRVPSTPVLYEALEVDNSRPFSINSQEITQSYFGHELAQDYRFQKSSNPVFRYDFKVGNYLPDSVKTLNQHLFTTMNDVTGGIRKPSWLFSKDFSSSIKVDASTYLGYFSTSSFFGSLREQYSSASAQLSSDFFKNGAYHASPTPTTGFYNLFSSVSANNSFLSTR